MKTTNLAIAAGLAALALAGCSTSSAGVASPAASPTAHSPAAHAKTAAKADGAINRCYARKNASGDIYVRMESPGTATVAQQLGGEWVWDVSAAKCLTSVQMMIAAAPQVLGSCTWVGYVSDNPGYDVNATPARPLRNVVASSGPSC